MTRLELDLVMRWAAGEGWNPGREDAEAFYAADAGGFHVGVLDERVIASISTVRYDEQTAFLGLYIVRPEYRGRGFGSRIWQEAIAGLNGRRIGLDGVVAQIPTYTRWGFAEAYRNVRYVTEAAPLSPSPASMIIERGRTRPRSAVDVSPLRREHLARVQAYDEATFGASRATFVEKWVTRPGTSALVARRAQQLVGYGAIRPAVDGYRIGPLFADDETVAGALFDALAAMVPLGARVAMDVPSASAAAIALVEARRMVPSFETARMYTRGLPVARSPRMFGVTSLELG